jgi:hypothetical protein
VRLAATAKKERDFDVKTFLPTVNGSRRILSSRKRQTISAQGDLSDAVFYIQQRE